LFKEKKKIIFRERRGWVKADPSRSDSTSGRGGEEAQRTSGPFGTYRGCKGKEKGGQKRTQLHDNNSGGGEDADGRQFKRLKRRERLKRHQNWKKSKGKVEKEERESITILTQHVMNLQACVVIEVSNSLGVPCVGRKKREGKRWEVSNRGCG